MYYYIFEKFGQSSNKGGKDRQRQRLDKTNIDGWLRFASVFIAHMLELIIMISEAQERKFQITVVFLSLVSQNKIILGSKDFMADGS